MRIIPVIDVKAGVPVHAVAGDRADYRPFPNFPQRGKSVLELAAGFRDELGLDELYLADLDAIAGSPVDPGLYRELRSGGTRLWLDPGIGDARTAARFENAADVLIVGLESVRSRDDLRAVVDVLGPDRAAFSLDLRDGRPIRPVDAAWREVDAESYVGTALDLGFVRVILLDLSRVGTGTGTGTGTLLERLAARRPDVEWVVGGGVRSIEDVAAAGRRGASAVLVGSALHDERIGRAEIDSL